MLRRPIFTDFNRSGEPWAVLYLPAIGPRSRRRSTARVRRDCDKMMGKKEKKLIVIVHTLSHGNMPDIYNTYCDYLRLKNFVPAVTETGNRVDNNNRITISRGVKSNTIIIEYHSEIKTKKFDGSDKSSLNVEMS